MPEAMPEATSEAMVEATTAPGEPTATSPAMVEEAATEVPDEMVGPTGWAS